MDVAKQSGQQGFCVTLGWPFCNTNSSLVPLLAPFGVALFRVRHLTYWCTVTASLVSAVAASTEVEEERRGEEMSWKKDIGRRSQGAEEEAPRPINVWTQAKDSKALLWPVLWPTMFIAFAQIDKLKSQYIILYYYASIALNPLGMNSW